MTLPLTDAVFLLLKQIFHTSYAQGDYRREMITSYIELFFWQLLQRYARADDPQAWGYGAEKSGMFAILLYLRRNYQTVTLKSLAKTFHYDVGYLSKNIKKHTGRSFTQIVDSLRMQDAKRLLLGGNAGIAAISEQCGYHSQIHFTRRFKQLTGMTPSAYRKQGMGASAHETA